ncbi:hypothetical protein D3D02_04320 [Halobellus sp. Atlit-38R]|jgi:hypothetical protein|uniref:hypothetical protein n=1 Tax=Halobellus sp. Atlit-38R TaxID=2282131 RepID=UPI000EF1D2A8|nr:hypothetical protein [Halobellus sp. Atlit-38R]RLM90989.1 hypothetical protein D3D02_04320 [Halobellus sp. Atlit-38R]
MVAVSAVAFAAGALSLYYGARSLRTKRALERLDADGDERLDAGTETGLAHPTDWLEPPSERSSSDDSASTTTESATNRRDDVSVERGFVLLVLGVVCLLFGFFAL